MRLLLFACGCCCTALQLSELVATLLDVGGDGLVSYSDFRRLPPYLHAAARAAAPAAAAGAAAAGARDAPGGTKGAAAAAAATSGLSADAPWWLEALVQGPRQAAATAAAAAELRDDVLLLLAAGRMQSAFERALHAERLGAPEEIPLAAAETRNVRQTP